MKNIKKMLVIMFLLITGLLIYDGQVYAVTCDAAECVSCYYNSGDKFMYHYNVRYDLKRYSDGRVEGNFVSEEDLNVAVENKINDYSFFLDESTNKLACPNIYIDSRLSPKGTLCNSGIVGLLVCNEHDMYKVDIYGKQGIELGLSTFLFGTINFRDENSSSGSVGTNWDDIQYTCIYTGQLNKQTLKISKSEGGWILERPDGNKDTLLDSDYKTKSFPTSNCEDIFQVTNNGSESIVTVEANTTHTETQISTLCNGNGNTVEQFCAGKCKISAPSCGSSKSSEHINTEGEGCPQELRLIIVFLKRVVFNTIQIFIPILLILMGTIDLTKAVMASDDKGNKEAISKFIKRFGAALMIFFLATIVTVVMGMFARTDVGEQNDWKTCWQSIK